MPVAPGTRSKPLSKATTLPSPLMLIVAVPPPVAGWPVELRLATVVAPLVMSCTKTPLTVSPATRLVADDVNAMV